MQLDLKSQVRTDGTFQSELFKLLQRLEQLEELALRDSGYVEKFQEAFYELLQFCEFNTSFLAPYFWPAYPKNKPLVFLDYPFAIPLFDILVGGFTVIRGSRQIAKSTSFACRQQMVARMLPGFRSLYITPRRDQLQTYQNKFRDLEKANRFYLKNSKLRQNLGYKEYANGSIVTRKQLEAICTLGRNLNVLHQKAQNRGYRWVVSGCDWGGSDYIPDLHIKVSTTVHVVVGICPTGQLDIIHFRRYAGMNYDDIVGDILYNHALLNGHAMASDFGVGAVYNSKIREKIPAERHLIFNYVGPTSDLISEPKGPHIYNQWSLNRTESISLTYEAVRNMRLRCFEWDMAQEYLQDFLNLFRAPGERAGTGSGAGATTFIYRAHPTKPNDSLMAVNYAHMLAKVLQGEPMLADLSMKMRLESALHGDLFGIHIADLPGAISG